MYEWLPDALNDSSHVLTASRRLARALKLEFARQQIAAGISAWRTPSIQSWQDWLVSMIGSAKNPQRLPTRINKHQGRLLWERSLRREISDPLVNIPMLARQADDAWDRVQQWLVPLDECESAAFGRDKRLFCRAARNYLSILKAENWVDQATLPSLVTKLVSQGSLALPRRLTVVGFDRIVPQVKALLDALEATGCVLETVSAPQACGNNYVRSYENSDAELRAAGAWARHELEQCSGQRIAVVVTNLEQDAQKFSHRLKEGLLPGWQNGGLASHNVVNVSYGRKLISYPSIETALLALRWLHSELSSTDISVLLRSAALGQSGNDGRIRLELWLRNLPDQAWTPERFLAALTANHYGKETVDWLRRIGRLADRRKKQPRRSSPAFWAELFDEVLTQLNWPGSEALDSLEFQLLNRWRELLNDLARLELVTPNMSLAEAHGRLLTLARETVFQPEANGAAVQLLGPLEAAGMQFDKLWIAGLTANNWPPTGKPVNLVSRDLQRRYSMPDADPQDTLDYADRVLTRLVRSAADCVISYPLTDGDAEQTVTALIGKFVITEGPEVPDPKWGAARLLRNAGLKIETSDPVPAICGDERVAGGAGTIQRQREEPFAAFVYGRLGVRRVSKFNSGLAASLRGKLIHDALHRLYADLPDSDAISGWSEEDIDARVDKSLRGALAGWERFAEPVMQRLLQFEKDRMRHLLAKVIDQDRQRDEFSVKYVEHDVDARIGGVPLRLRYDRIDQVADGEIVILDYKTGVPKKLLNRGGEPYDLQLVTYACAMQESVAGIGLINIDTRAVTLQAAGRFFTPELEWDQSLASWSKQVETAAAEIARGDIRINWSLAIPDARPLALLSRFQELVRDN